MKNLVTNEVIDAFIRTEGERGYKEGRDYYGGQVVNSGDLIKPTDMVTWKPKLYENALRSSPDDYTILVRLDSHLNPGPLYDPTKGSVWFKLLSLGKEEGSPNLWAYSGVSLVVMLYVEDEDTGETAVRSVIISGPSGYNSLSFTSYMPQEMIDLKKPFVLRSKNSATQEFPTIELFYYIVGSSLMRSQEMTLYKQGADYQPQDISKYAYLGAANANQRYGMFITASLFKYSYRNLDIYDGAISDEELQDWMNNL